MAAKQPKPTKQQIAVAKARAGGNTTSKTTGKAMLKGAKEVALFAATIAGPGKVVKGAKVVNKLIKGKKVVKVLTEPKSAVRVKPAARTKPNKPDVAKTNYKNLDTYKRARAAEIKAGNDPETAHEVALGMKYFYGQRKPNLEIKASSGKPDVRKPARVPDKRATKTRIINSAKNVRVVKVNLKKKPGK